MFKKLMSFWGSYKYRFVPWISANLENRSVRRVEAGLDEVLSPAHIESLLIKLFEALHQNEQLPLLHDHRCREGNRQEWVGALGEGHSRSNPGMKWNGDIPSESSAENPLKDTSSILTGSHQDQKTTTYDSSSTLKPCHGDSESKRRQSPSEIMLETFGYSVYRAPSRIEGGGTGVFVSGGVPQHQVVALYPGTIYLPHEPILVQSVGNPFIFRCSDGLLVDGHDRRLSKLIYRSCSRRDRIAPGILSSDLSWPAGKLQNPLNVGQYINNHTTDFKANVAYQEYDVEQDFPMELRKYLPNVFYGAGYLHKRALRIIVLVSLREIGYGEELLSDYFTLIH